MQRLKLFSEYALAVTIALLVGVGLATTMTCGAAWFDNLQGFGQWFMMILWLTFCAAVGIRIAAHK